MYKYEVGELLQKGITYYDEGMKFDFTQEGTVLLIFFNKPTKDEIESVRSGDFEVRFYIKDGIIFILSKFQKMPWMDAPYSIHLSKPFEFMEMDDTQGFSLTIYLVDASTGVLKVIRYIGLGNEFSKQLKSAVEEQKIITFDKANYHKKLSNIYEIYATDDLMRMATFFYKTK